VESRLAAQNALFEDAYERGLKTHPERATAYAYYRYNDRLDEYPLAAISSEHQSDADFLLRLKAISTSGCSEQDTLAHEVLLRTLEPRIRNYQFQEYQMPLSQMAGPQAHLADLPLAVPFDSVKLLRLAKPENHLVRAAANDRVENSMFMIIIGVAKGVALGFEDEAGGFDLAYDRSWINAMQRLRIT